ncbi:hypothetical protein OWV82_016456 [Melia azedarach]|uniref:Uncharacterized protein n=1 Tax=Melia azedarach TaxID=155640 RepID=A0ACC1XHE3_MELAZ|nr:hypothetical protein OWV82_016456 [Melia azedarach]
MSRSHTKTINIAAILLVFIVLSTVPYPLLTEARILNFQAIQVQLSLRERLVHRTLRVIPPAMNTPPEKASAKNPIPPCC